MNIKYETITVEIVETRTTIMSSVLSHLQLTFTRYDIIDH